MAASLAEGAHKFIPEVLVAGAGGGPTDGLAGVLTRYIHQLTGGNGRDDGEAPKVEPTAKSRVKKDEADDDGPRLPHMP